MFGFSCLSCWCAALSYTSSCLCVCVCLTFKCVYMCVFKGFYSIFILHSYSTRCYKSAVASLYLSGQSKKQYYSSYLQHHLIVLVFIAEFWTQQIGLVVVIKQKNTFDGFLSVSLCPRRQTCLWRRGWNLSGNQTYQMKKTQKHDTSFTTHIHE